MQDDAQLQALRAELMAALAQMDRCQLERVREVIERVSTPLESAAS